MANKPPKDTNQRAKAIVDFATGQGEPFIHPIFKGSTLHIKPERIESLNQFKVAEVEKKLAIPYNEGVTIIAIVWDIDPNKIPNLLDILKDEKRSH